jgi:hypothetical protein
MATKRTSSGVFGEDRRDRCGLERTKGEVLQKRSAVLG